MKKVRKETSVLCKCYLRSNQRIWWEQVSHYRFYPWIEEIIVIWNCSSGDKADTWKKITVVDKKRTEYVHCENDTCLMSESWKLRRVRLNKIWSMSRKNIFRVCDTMRAHYVPDHSFLSSQHTEWLSFLFSGKSFSPLCRTALYQELRTFAEICSPWNFLLIARYKHLISTWALHYWATLGISYWFWLRKQSWELKESLSF